MSANSEITARAIRDAVSRTFDGFRADFSQWENEVERLLDDVTGLLSTEAELQAASHNALAEDVAALRALVEQQTEVLSALVNALTGENAPASGDETAPEPPPEEALSDDLEGEDFESLEESDLVELEDLTEDLVLDEAQLA